jgi:acetamidase/formamidase
MSKVLTRGWILATCIATTASISAPSRDEKKSDLTGATPEGILQCLKDKPTKLAEGRFYVPVSPATVSWGYLPNRDSKPILTIPSGSVVVFDTLSGEGIMEDQGRNPVRFFGKYGVKRSEILNDAVEIAASNIKHDFMKDGPHIIVGPVAIDGAQPGDVLKIDMITLQTRVPYGLICCEQGKGALPGEFPENAGTQPGASAEHPELYNDVFTFVPVRKIGGKQYGIVHTAAGKEVHFSISPFIGTMGAAPNTSDQQTSIPPGSYGGNLDLKELTAGSTLYVPVQVPGAMYFIGDPHFAQGNGEVALTALEGSLRATVRLTILKAGDAGIPGNGSLSGPFAETQDCWIPIGLDPDLQEAMKKAVRAGISFLVNRLNMDRATALAYMSAATDFDVTQVVDITKGIHAKINKKDFTTNP